MSTPESKVVEVPRHAGMQEWLASTSQGSRLTVQSIHEFISILTGSSAVTWTVDTAAHYNKASALAIVLCPIRNSNVYAKRTSEAHFRAVVAFIIFSAELDTIRSERPQQYPALDSLRADAPMAERYILQAFECAKVVRELAEAESHNEDGDSLETMVEHPVGVRRWMGGQWRSLFAGMYAARTSRATSNRGFDQVGPSQLYLLLRAIGIDSVSQCESYDFKEYETTEDALGAGRGGLLHISPGNEIVRPEHDLVQFDTRYKKKGRPYRCYCLISEENLAYQVLFLTMFMGERGWALAKTTWSPGLCAKLARKFFLGLMHGTRDSSGVARYIAQHGHCPPFPETDLNIFFATDPWPWPNENLIPPVFAQIKDLKQILENVDLQT